VNELDQWFPTLSSDHAVIT